MHSLLLKFKAPLQAWGAESRYKTRASNPEPTKSGVIGLLAAAQGRARQQPLADLAALSFAVRVDYPRSAAAGFSYGTQLVFFQGSVAAEQSLLFVGRCFFGGFGR